MGSSIESNPDCSPLTAAGRLVLGAACLLLALSSPAHADPESPWGVSPSAALSYNPEPWAQRMADAGVTWVRGFRVTGDPASLAPLRKASLAICGVLMWSATQPATFPVHDLARFRSYVIQTVKSYRGTVTHWEVWNEPPNFSADPAAASYAKVVATAYEAAKSVDPHIQIGLAAKSVDIQFLAEAIRKGAKDHFDFITLHPYETISLLPQGWESPYLGIVANVRAMLRDTDPRKHDAPIWFTEVGMEATPRGPTPVSEQLQADILVKVYTMALAQGVARIHWFDPQDSEGHTYGLLRADGTQRPAYRALSQLISALGSKPRFLGYVPSSDDSYNFLFAGPKHDVLIAWARLDSTHPVTFPEPIEIIDPDSAERETNSTFELRHEPRIFLAPRSSKTAKSWRKALTAHRPAWDQSAEANSVTFQAGGPARGIRAIGPVKPSCQAERCEISLSKHSGLRFAIDPLFQGYSGRPLEVLLTLLPHNSPRAGFNLKYEVSGVAADGHGMTGTGKWNYVHGDSPITLKFKLVNPSFVGKYGANLTVDCDTVEQCDFGVMSLVINKK